MPKYGLQYMHNGSLYEVHIFADCLDDAHSRVESIKATGELDDGEIIHEEEASDDVVAWAQVRAEALKEQMP